MDVDEIKFKKSSSNPAIVQLRELSHKIASNRYNKIDVPDQVLALCEKYFITMPKWERNEIGEAINIDALAGQ